MGTWKRTLLLSHHGVKQCFHTMDVAANYWATAASPSAGPISAKSASLMKNAIIFVAKRTKNWAWEAREVQHALLFFFSLRLVFFFNRHDWNKQPQQAESKKKKKTQLSREDHVSSKVGFLKFCYLLFLANNYETVILNIETIFCKTVLLPLLVELEFELELETKSPFGAETETNIWYLEQHLTWVSEFWRCIARVHWLHYSRGMHFFFFSFSFLLVMYII